MSLSFHPRADKDIRRIPQQKVRQRVVGKIYDHLAGRDQPFAGDKLQGKRVQGLQLYRVKCDGYRALYIRDDGGLRILRVMTRAAVDRKYS